LGGEKGRELRRRGKGRYFILRKKMREKLEMLKFEMGRKKKE